MNNEATDERRLHMKRTEKLQTTLGELIVALTDELRDLVGDEKKTYAMVAVILADLCNERNPLALLCD